jgi:acetoin utilization deacetylase AcuC-like enzyme
MKTAYITHSACLRHDMGEYHPECPQRLHVLEDQLITERLMDLLRYYDAPQAEYAHLARVHTPGYIESIVNFSGTARHLDSDTIITHYTPTAALHAAGAAILATDVVLRKEVDNAFCNVRPPGHHASQARAMGFCFFNNIAVAAAHALAEYGLERVAICDFDVHHGNGTQDIFVDDPRVLLCSSFQHPFYPFSPLVTNHPRIIHTPLAAGTRSQAFRDAISASWAPALKDFAPQMIFISAGFDAHVQDEMSQVLLQDVDYQWITEFLLAQAEDSAAGRIVSLLEGGYALNALARSAVLHVKILMGVSS